MAHSTATILWARIRQQLEEAEKTKHWQNRIVSFEQVSAVEARRKGGTFADKELFSGLVRSVLSNSTDWSRIESMSANLQSLFCDYHIAACAGWQIADIAAVVEEFKRLGAGSMTLRSGLKRLALAAQKLCHWSKSSGSCDMYLSELFKRVRSDPKKLVLAISGPGCPDKIPGLGTPLAAEFLKNIGYDVAKPDRHINRAVGSFGWVQFKNWSNRNRTTPPTATEPEMMNVMVSMESFARCLEKPVAYVDNAVWILCAKSGAHLSNEELVALAK